MSAEFHSYEPVRGHGLPHDPFNAIVAPRPIGWISTVSATGVRNLAPYSFFNAFNYVPPIIGFSSMGWKDSVANVEAMNASSATVAAEVDEFVHAGLDALPSLLVKPDRVAGSPVQFECKLTQLIRLETKEGRALDQWLVLGEAVAIHIDKAMLEDGIYQTGRASPILRGGGPADYFEIGEDALFRMRRPG